MSSLKIKQTLVFVSKSEKCTTKSFNGPIDLARKMISAAGRLCLSLYLCRKRDRSKKAAADGKIINPNMKEFYWFW